ncbi:MAG: ammonia-forming cytochrome c nitrite reductase subunit c552 [Pelosinus sp.]|nr:ammonia-forming cytochrome c nitrite reductase subunit c552 [Pelosinus sp.]
MSKMQKSLAVLLAVCVVFFGFVIVRIGAKPNVVKAASIPKDEYDPAVWGKYYPLEYESYMKNYDMSASPTGYGGSLKVQKSDMQPELFENFKGMPFSKDYTEDRGHLFALEDIKDSKRVGPATKGACITCKTPYIEQFYKEDGWGYANKPFAELWEKSKHPVSCANCHDSETMNLRVINPAFIEAMQRRGVDVTKASREEMRTYVCAQCHVEYYFEPETTRVVLPWDKGTKPDEMYSYYADKPNGFIQDWQHPDSKAAMLKAQHPDYETFSNGTHGKSGVSCADCHMPYMRKDGQKYSSHWMTSPLKTLDASCSPCHTQGSSWAMERVKTIQDSTWQMQHTAGTTIARAHEAIKKASEVPNVNQEELAKARELVRKAQWFWDIVAAESSMGFHNPDQVISTLGQANQFAYEAIDAAERAAGMNIY